MRDINHSHTSFAMIHLYKFCETSIGVTYKASLTLFHAIKRHIHQMAEIVHIALIAYRDFPGVEEGRFCIFEGSLEFHRILDTNQVGTSGQSFQVICYFADRGQGGDCPVEFIVEREARCARSSTGEEEGFSINDNRSYTSWIIQGELKARIKLKETRYKLIISSRLIFWLDYCKLNTIEMT